MSESRPSQCSQCTKAASVHVSKVIDGQLIKLSMCSGCPEAIAIASGVGYDLIEAKPSKAAKVTRSSYRDSQRACPNCGLTPADFKEHGRMGCSQCYEIFEDKLEPILKKLHSGVTHSGKRPGTGPMPESQLELADLPDTRLSALGASRGSRAARADSVPAISAERLEDLKRQLQDYVAREEYELAAAIRDQIKSLGGEE